MATATGISLAEYLATDYRPDREYLDGEVVETEMVLVLSGFGRHMAVTCRGRMPRSEHLRQAARAGPIA